MDQKMSSGAGQGFGVAGFVIGIIALILSFIPCIGMYALIPGIVALIFAVIGLAQASSANAPQGLIIAALVIAIIGTSIAAWQLVTVRRATRGLERIGRELPGIRADDIGNEIRENIRRALEEIEEGIDPDTVPDDTIRFDSEEMIEELERLEGEEPTETEDP
ncbi:MAG: hypothetical protein EA408_10435 [Marinilabiliales bacterium]|nr:MAG: hypothetical protein EA408_10435 [Marinilabiliales bacterium]